MAYYALLDENNVVESVIKGIDETEMDGEVLYTMMFHKKCKRTSFNTHHGKHYSSETGQWAKARQFRMNFAMPGYIYDEERDAFIPPKPFDSWILDEEICDWEAPVEMPDDGQMYIWDEETTNWVVVEETP